MTEFIFNTIQLKFNLFNTMKFLFSLFWLYTGNALGCSFHFTQEFLCIFLHTPFTGALEDFMRMVIGINHGLPIKNIRLGALNILLCIVLTRTEAFTYSVHFAVLSFKRFGCNLILLLLFTDFK